MAVSGGTETRARRLASLPPTRPEWGVGGSGAVPVRGEQYPRSWMICGAQSICYAEFRAGVAHFADCLLPKCLVVTRLEVICRTTWQHGLAASVKPDHLAASIWPRSVGSRPRSRERAGRAARSGLHA